MIKKAIIPVAGLASRFLPASKVIPKTMFPIIDKPIIQFLIEEALEAGITDIAVILSERQEMVKEHFKKDEYLENELKERNKQNAAKKIHAINELPNIQFFIQNEPKGDGHALLQAEGFLEEDEACLVLFGDELIGNDTENAAIQLVKAYEKHQTPIMGVQEVESHEVHRYGIVGLKEGSQDEIESLIEKPDVDDAPSNLALVGKYVINKGILEYIKKSNSGTKDGELRLIDGFKTYLKGQKIHSSRLDGERFDTGNKLGLIKANVYFGLKDHTMRDDLKDFLRSIEK